MVLRYGRPIEGDDSDFRRSRGFIGVGSEEGGGEANMSDIRKDVLCIFGLSCEECEVIVFWSKDKI